MPCFSLFRKATDGVFQSVLPALNLGCLKPIVPDNVVSGPITLELEPI